MKKIRLICALALVVCLVTVSCFTVSAANVTGTVGDCSWVLADGNLMISGGAMPNYTQSGETPWYNSYASSIESVVITGSVTHIGSHAFSELANLRTVTITAKSTNKLTICDGAFTGCPSLESVILPDNLVSIGSGAFSNCVKLTSITIPTNVTSVGTGAFANCSALSTVNFNATRCSTMGTLLSPVFLNSPIKKLNFGDTVKYIPDYAFRQSKIVQSPTEITIPESVYYIGEYAFAFNTSLETVNLPDKLTSLPQYVFYGCSALTSINTPKLLTAVGNYAFFDCSSLGTLSLPATVSSIGYGAFKGCSALTVSTAYDSYASLVAEEYGINCSYGDSSEFTNNTHSAALFSNGQLSVTVAVDEPIKGEYIHMAFFNDKDEVVNYIVTPTPTGTATNSVSISVDEERVGDAAYLKVFIWDSLKTCKPVSPAEKITIKK